MAKHHIEGAQRLVARYVIDLEGRDLAVQIVLEERQGRLPPCDGLPAMW